MILERVLPDRIASFRASIVVALGTHYDVKMGKTIQDLSVDLVKQAYAIAIEKCCRTPRHYDFNDTME